MRLDKALKQFAFITTDSLVGDVETGAVCTLSDWKNRYANAPREKRIGTNISLSMPMAWLEHPERESCEHVVFRPDKGRLFDGCFNVWESPWPRRQLVEVRENAFFMELLHQVYPHNTEEVVQLYAHLVQRPWERPQWGIVSTTPQTGTGRSTFGEFWAEVLGDYYVALNDLDRLVKPNFNGQLDRRLMIVVHEVYQGQARERRLVSDKLKNVVTDVTMEINRKFKAEYVARLYCRVVLNSNHPDALIIDESDRRLLVILGNMIKMSKAMAREFARLRADPEWRAEVIGWFGCVPLTDCVFEAPPMTDAKAQMIDLSEAPTVADIMHTAQMMLGDGDLVDINEVMLMAGRDPKRDAMAGRQAMINLGAVKLGRKKTVHGLHTIWCLRNADVWINASADAIRAHLDENRAKH